MSTESINSIRRIMKPQLAKDADLTTLNYPLWAMPKIDGVRALNLTGTLTGRSLKTFEGYGITEYWSKPEFKFLDGEMIIDSDPASSDRLCSRTTGAMGAFKGITEMADLTYCVFDYLENPELPYKDRYAKLKSRVEELAHPKLWLVPYEVVNNTAEMEAVIEKHLAAGFEGTVTRNPDAPAKEDRPTKKGQQFLRFKPWDDTEMLVTGITEGNANTNQATTNELGRTERSSAKDGMVPNGMVGSLQGILLEDYYSPITGTKLFDKGLKITISKGSMTHEEARYYFLNPDKVIGHVAKFSHFVHGTKDLPRMGGYLSHRLAVDMS